MLHSSQMHIPPDRDDLDAMYRYITHGVSAIIRQPDTGDMKFIMSFYTVIHNACTKLAIVPIPATFGNSARAQMFQPLENLYLALIDSLQQCLKDLVDEIGVQRDKTIVDGYIEVWDRYMTASRRIKNLFSYLTLHWIRDQLSEGRGHVYEVDELCLLQWDLVVYKEAVKTVGPSAWELLVTKPKQDRPPILEHPKIKQIIESFAIPPLRGSPRPIYVGTDASGKYWKKNGSNLEHTSTSSSQESETIVRNTQSNDSLLPSAGQHWFLLVECDDGGYTLFDIRISRDMGKKLIKLQPVHMVEKRPRLNTSQVGYTFLADDEIKCIGDTIIEENGEIYRLLYNDCQLFCRRLFLCIRAPFRADMVFEALRAVPHQIAEQETARQFKECEINCLYFGDMATEALAMSMPIPAVTVVYILSMMVVLVQPYAWLAVLLFVYSYNTNVETLRIWHGYISEPKKDELFLVFHFLHANLDNSERKSILDAILGVDRLFAPATLICYDHDSHSARSVQYSEYADSENIEDTPIGFDPEDIKMANQKEPPNTQDDSQVYQISIMFVRGANSPLLGHAEIILRYGDLENIPPPDNMDLVAPQRTLSPKKLTILTNGILPKERAGLKVLHLRLTDRDTLALALEELPGQMRFYRYVDLYRIRTTERMLKHIALQSCPGKHRALVDDCATFVYNFLTSLLDHLESRGEISKEELQCQRKLLIKHNHVADGTAGTSEVATRQHPTLREGAYVSMVSAENVVVMTARKRQDLRAKRGRIMTTQDREAEEAMIVARPEEGIGARIYEIE